MTAPDTRQPADDAREETLFRTDIEFLQARIEFNEIQQKTITEEIHLNNDAIEVQVLETRAASEVSDASHLEELGHDVYEASTDVQADPTASFERLTSEKDDLVARYEEFQRQPIEMRDPAEAQAMVQQMHELVDQANATHEDFMDEKSEVEVHISDARAEVQAVLDAHDAHAVDDHDTDGGSAGGSEAHAEVHAEVHATIDHHPADESSSDSHDLSTSPADSHDTSATSGDGG